MRMGPFSFLVIQLIVVVDFESDLIYGLSGMFEVFWLIRDNTAIPEARVSNSFSALVECYRELANAAG